jgi:hypothetical protein
MAFPTSPATLAALQAMQAIILGEVTNGVISYFAALSAADQARYGVARAVFVGQPKDFADAYLPQCHLFIPSAFSPLRRSGEGLGEGMVSYAVGRIIEEIEATVRVFVDLRTDWWAGEQTILAIRDSLQSAMLRHQRLGGSVPAVIESWAREGRGLCYESVAGTEYRCYEAIWGFRQQWQVAGGKVL